MEHAQNPERAVEPPPPSRSLPDAAHAALRAALGAHLRRSIYDEPPATSTPRLRRALRRLCVEDD